MKSKHILIIDPIAFPGGSKIATLNMIQLLDKKTTRVTVVTKDAESWDSQVVSTSPLLEAESMSHKEQGIGFFLRHYLLLFSILIARLRYGKFNIAMGASGPGVDLSLYLGKRFFHYDIIQLIHGPVAKSRSIGRALIMADKVFYLDSTRDSIISALSSIHTETKVLQLLAEKKFETFINGLSEYQWPTRTQIKKPTLYWAASLLKWKGLDTFIETLNRFKNKSILLTHICYIKPKAINHEITQAPIVLDDVYWHEEPRNLDQIRAQCNIFISTSHKEPFGLSILESMAAGHAIIIPADGSYWDQCLEDETHCLKYKPGDVSDLAQKIKQLQKYPRLLERLSNKAFVTAQQYRAEKTYSSIISALSTKDHNAVMAHTLAAGQIDHA